MTVSSTTNKNIYVGNGALLVFAYTFKIFEDADLDVSIQDTSVSPQTEITLVLNQDYTVSDAGNPAGGNVTLIVGGASQLTAAPSATDNITIRRVLPLTQETDYVENDEFPAEAHEEVADRGTMVDQQLQETLARALVIPANLTGISTELPSPSAGAPIGWNAAGDGLTNNPPQDNYSAVDAAATPDFIGATGSTGVIRVDSTLNYVDGGDFVTISVAPGAVDHDALLNFVANEHIDHTSVSINTTAPLAGGGDISSTRTLTLDINAATAATVASGDLVVVADISDSNNPKKVTAQSIADLAGSGGIALDEAVAQATHGFSVGDWVYFDGANYALADASAAATVSGTVGVVSAVADANNFTVQVSGKIAGLSGLTAGAIHYISETAGQITATAPATVGAFVKGALVADSTTSGFIVNHTAIENVAAASTDGCRVYNTTNQSINNATQTALAYNSERYDNGGLHDTVTNNTRITIATTGIYSLWAGVAWAANATGIRQVNLTVNGTSVIATQQTHSPNGTNSFNMITSSIAQLTAGDYVEVFVYQDSGGALNVVGGGGGSSQEFAVQKIG